MTAGTKDRDYPYDVAFSFLYQDEGAAVRLNELIKPTLKTFIYTEHQKTLAGRDGEKLFSEVFGEQSRLVAILYRGSWGTTNWTRIEQTAIRGRGFDQGYDFAVLIPMEKGLAPPPWFPKNRLWIGLERFGFDGAAIALETMAQERGGQIREETVAEKAERLKRTEQLAARRRGFLNSTDGVVASRAAFAALPDALQKVAQETASTFPVTIKTEPGKVIVLGKKLGLATVWHVEYANSLDKSVLKIEIWGGQPPMITRPSIYDDEKRKLQTFRGSYDHDGADFHGWKIGDSGRIVSNEGLADYLLKALINEEFDRI